MWAGLGDRLQASRQIRFRSDDRVVHTVIAAEIADVAIAAVDAHADAERVLDAGVAPFGVEPGDPVLHLDRHAQAGFRIFGVALGVRIAEEDQHGVADEFVDGSAMRQGDLGHFGEILVQQFGDLFRLQAFGRGGEILDVGKEDRQPFALGMDGDVLLPAENALVDLRRQIARDLHRHRSEKFVGGFELAVHRLDQRRLTALQDDEHQPDPGHQHEIGEQIFEGEQIGANRLRGRHFL